MANDDLKLFRFFSERMRDWTGDVESGVMRDGLAYVIETTKERAIARLIEFYHGAALPEDLEIEDLDIMPGVVFADDNGDGFWAHHPSTNSEDPGVARRLRQ